MRVVRFLDCPSEDEEGETALMLAAKRKNRSFSKLLLYTQNQLICMYVCMYVCIYALLSSAYSAIYSCPSELTPMSGAQGDELQV